tara:strand:- start:7 stop:1308 length:1302 start_codon:yes stop_codon:yes gene_type:complete
MPLYLYKNKLIKEFNIEKFGFFCFLAGIFFLASAVGISIILLLVSVIVSFLKPDKFLKDKWNYPLLLSGILMVISTSVHFQRYEKYIDLGLDPKLSLLGLVNWLPFFLCFWGFQNYLNSPQKRLITSKLLISGSIPVIFSGILQLFNINGPFELFYGLVVWFQKPIDDIGSLAGLFNNPNYAGLWMVLVWPFCLSELYNSKKSRLKNFTILVITILFVCFIFLTDSRNAILSLIISSPIVLGSTNLIWYLPTISLGFILLGLTVLPIIPNEIKLFMESIIPSRFYTLFPEIGLNNISSYPRINKWISSFSLISKNPIFGWGAASFPILYSLKGEHFGHAHNLPIEFAISYGILPSLIIFTSYGIILYLSFKKISRSFKNNSLEIDYFLNSKAWFAASLIFLLSHLFDIQYFDARISTLCWILLAGLRCFLKED